MTSVEKENIYIYRFIENNLHSSARFICLLSSFVNDNIDVAFVMQILTNETSNNNSKASHVIDCK
jgi:hypothetical protein